MCRKPCWPSCWPVCKNEKEPRSCRKLQLRGSFSFLQTGQQDGQHGFLHMEAVLRFGDSEKDLVGALLFLLNNEAAGFITGICLPIDGGFSAYSGV